MNIQNLADELLDGKKELLNEFLGFHKNINLCDPIWETPLIIHAVYGGNIENVKLLINAGADINQKAGQPGRFILAPTALSLAKQCLILDKKNSFSSIIKLLESNGAL